MNLGVERDVWRRTLGAGLMLAVAWALVVQPRAHAVDQAYSTYIACEDCLGRAVWAADFWLYAAWLLLLLLGLWLPQKLWRGLSAVAVILTMLLYFIDLGIFRLFGSRLHPADIMRYGGDMGSAASVVVPLLKEAWVAQLMVGMLLCTWAFAVAWRVPSLAQHAQRPVKDTELLPLLPPTACLLLVVLGGGAMAQRVGDVQYVHAQAYRSVWESWSASGENRAFSSGFLQQAQQTAPAEIAHCETGGRQQRSVILVVVESLSAYHSRAMGGHLDATPRMDARLATGTRFESFVANGFTTDGGLIALLAGRVPVPAVGRFKSSQAYSGFERVHRDGFFEELHAAGYRTQFFTTGRLDFLGKGDWLRGLGIQQVEGAESPWYQGLPKGSFDDVGDAHLYRRYLAWLDAQDHRAPYFSTLLTVSTHPPFVVPGTSIRDEVSAFRYADEALDTFLEALEARGFFEKGVLMVVGDHRAMTVVHTSEVSRHGLGAGAMPWAAVFGHSGMLIGTVPGRWQQTDFLPTLAHWAGLPSCTDPYHGRFAGPRPVPADWVLHAHGQHRDLVLAWRRGDAKAYELMLQGDATGWASTPTHGDAAAVLADVNHWRAQLPILGPDEVIGMVARRLRRKH